MGVGGGRGSEAARGGCRVADRREVAVTEYKEDTRPEAGRDGLAVEGRKTPRREGGGGRKNR
jgi:hypothetical protein